MLSNMEKLQEWLDKGLRLIVYKEGGFYHVELFKFPRTKTEASMRSFAITLDEALTDLFDTTDEQVARVGGPR